MNWDQVEGQWKGLKGQVRETWAKLTDDDIELIGGKKDRLLGKLQERYGLERLWRDATEVSVAKLLGQSPAKLRARVARSRAPAKTKKRRRAGS